LSVIMNAAYFMKRIEATYLLEIIIIYGIASAISKLYNISVRKSQPYYHHIVIHNTTLVVVVAGSVGISVT
jgi:hypothetical protein